MNFDYSSYELLISTLQEYGYHNAGYADWGHFPREFILRHDVDNDLNKAVKLAALEQMLGVASTYFVLITSDFYNVFSRKNREALQQILAYGHEIGLHFDETCYSSIAGTVQKLCEEVIREARLLEAATGFRINVVSMHRPSRQFLSADVIIPGMINSYSSIFFRKFKYLSDSRRNWREAPLEIIKSGMYEKLHILTHPFWYKTEEKSMEQTLQDFVGAAKTQRWETLRDNLTDIDSVFPKERLLKG